MNNEITLQVGKTYIDGMGRTVKITGTNIGMFRYTGAIVNSGYVEGQTNTYQEDGRWSFDGSQPHERDLVKEVPGISDPMIPHAAMIRSVLDGKTVQREVRDGYWVSMNANPLIAIEGIVTQPDFNYRIKPEPAVSWCACFKEADGRVWWGDPFDDRAVAARVLSQRNIPDAKLLRIELDPDTLEVISAKTEAP